MNIKTLIDKLTDIELSIGVQNNTTVRDKVIDVQDCLLQMQRERAEPLRMRSRHNAVRLASYLSLGGFLFHRGWRRAFAAIRPHGAASPPSRR